ncbi:MAG: hypothetical protein IPN60_01540 [Saprospiraceae bacterium]|nr:hypothetical protein [Candidatus Opimibacter skivensis]MBP8086745.1 hypothetical protein [Saprospiraceae bacterium]
MIRRILHTALLITSFAFNAWSQSSDTTYYHWNLGISAGDILHELFNGENSNKSYPAFVLEYSGQQYSVQAGFRTDYNMTNTSYDGFLDQEVDESLDLSGNLAMTRHIFNSKNWLIKAGLQFAGGWSRQDINEDSGFDRVITRRLEWNAGLGPVIDFRYFVHPRISLGTEASLIYSVTRSELQQIFTNFPDFNNTKETVEGNSLVVNEPATIYLRFHF